MDPRPIQYFNRYTQKLETEQVYGERWLRFTYENPVGRFFLGLVVKRWFFSWVYGFQMNKRVSANKVLPFIVKYQLDAEEFAKTPWEYKTFNEFFSRKLKKEARPIAEGPDEVILPADGRHLVFPHVGRTEGHYVKGSKLSLAELFGEDELPEDKRELTRRFEGGAMVISRLCPVDYHRFHFPVAGLPSAARNIGGYLFSVSPIALRNNIEYLARNKRTLTLIDSPQAGQVAMFEVGATNVGSIVQTFAPDHPVTKGEEKGLFKFGGSCVILLFEPGRILFEQDLVTQSAQFVETFAKMGDRLGRLQVVAR